MQVLTTADMLEALATAQRLRTAARTTRAALDTGLPRLATDLQALTDVYLEAAADGVDAEIAALRALLARSEQVAGAHDMVATSVALERRLQAATPEVEAAWRALADVAGVDAHPALLTDELRAALAAARATGPDPARTTRRFLAATVSRAPESAGELLAKFTRVRLSALHALVLTELAAAAPDATSAGDADLAALGTEASRRVAGLRDAAHVAAGRLHAGGVTPTLMLELWTALAGAEAWLSGPGLAALRAVTAAATARGAAGGPEAERWAREAAQAYDAFRRLLAFDAGVRVVLRACATADAAELEAFAATRELRLGSATEDLPRSSHAAVMVSAPGAAVEIDGLVTGADITAGGPAPRSVLTLAANGAGDLRVLVPFIAADSFGVTPGIWVQVRGSAHPEGKDGLPGPVVMAARVRREAAARESFTDALIWAGRDAFELRPGGLDIVAGRLAGAAVTRSEIGLRAQV
jgi:hypothetical protein